MNQQERFSFEIPARDFAQLETPTQETLGFYILEIQTEQRRNVLDDIGAYIIDHENFLIWRTLRGAVRAGARGSGFAQVTMLASAKFNWGTLSFQPEAAGLYHLVLDNTHSQITGKNVTVLAYWVPYEAPSGASPIGGSVVAGAPTHVSERARTRQFSGQRSVSQG